MAGIYIHIPFCLSKCDYCDFYSLSQQPVNEFVEMLLLELQLRKKYLSDLPVSTVYFGGGTPSLLQPVDIKNIVEGVRRNFELEADAEITLEANPDDLSDSYLKSLSEGPVNRLSIGIQSFDDQILAFLNRRHNAAAAEAAVKTAQKHGFHNISGDLIYSVPGMSGDLWRESLQCFFDLGIPHLSAYDLIYENNTPLTRKKNRGEIMPQSDEKSEEYFTILTGEAAKHGYSHYEISNLAKPAYESRHNASYWKGVSYLGIGPAAHSYNGESRSWNVADLHIWQKALREEKAFFETEQLSKKDKFNELIITGLRCEYGVSLNQVRTDFGSAYYNYLSGFLKQYKNSLKIQNESLVLDKSVWFVSDSIISNILIEREL